PRDNPKLTELEQRPYHLINTGMNMTSSEHLGWQERKAASFVLSRDYCGYEFPKVGPSVGNVKAAFQRTGEFTNGRGSINLGTAMAISGAAASPNMGYHSSPSVAFLLTVFNVRLGWWMQNPSSRRNWAGTGPHFGLRYLMFELFGLSNDKSRFVQLSDGGHFDNLGVYEMVLRRCRYIIACDASADRKYAFGDLANSVRRIRVDFGVPIEFLSAIYIGPQQQGRLGKYCALANIRYDLVDGDVKPGRLLYIKPAVYDDCPPDVKNYEKESDGFPHESTADQFFTESQFESYRALGRHMVDQMVIDQDRNDWRADSIEAFLDRAGEYLDGKLAQAALAKQV
ncbi:MAG: patatin-like phospholipase family protein, partial [Thermoanaerobaculia bacterium]